MKEKFCSCANSGAAYGVAGSSTSYMYCGTCGYLIESEVRAYEQHKVNKRIEEINMQIKNLQEEKDQLITPPVKP